MNGDWLSSYLMLDGDGRIVHAAPEARTVLGVRLPDLVGRSIGDVAAPADRLRLARWLSDQAGPTTSSPSGAPSCRFRVPRRHGADASAQARMVALGDAGEWRGVVVEVEGSGRPVADGSHDVTLLEDQIDRLTRANRELEAFASTAAHDLQAPLAAVAASVDLLVRRSGADLDEPSQQLIGSVLRGVGQMSQLVDGLLRCSMAGARLNVRHLDGDALVREAIGDVRSELDAVEAQVTVAPIGPLVGDAGQLRSVFSNLLSNAVRYRSPERRLHISLEVEDGAFERAFTLTDNGRGIPSADRERSFAMFERLDASIPGSGIGLATCKRIIEGHGGRIWMGDGLDGGLAVRFALPAQVIGRPG